MTTNPVYVHDLAWWLPLMGVGAWWLWDRRPLGYVVTGVGLVMWVVESLTQLTVALMATQVPPTRLGAGTPADRGMSYEDVVFTTADGVRLSAWARRRW